MTLIVIEERINKLRMSRRAEWRRELKGKRERERERESNEKKE
jgi:hypothetical protein